MPDMTVDEAIEVNFGCLPPLPNGYSVKWHPNLEVYLGHGPNEWESPISWNRFWVRRFCMEHATLVQEGKRRKGDG